MRLNPPQGKQHLQSLTLWAVLVQEIDTHAGITPLCWLLLTTLPVTNSLQAIEKVNSFSRRSGIEVYLSHTQEQLQD